MSCRLLLVSLLGLCTAGDCRATLRPAWVHPGEYTFAGVGRAEPDEAAPQSKAPRTAASADLNALLQQAENALERKDYQAALAPLQTVVHSAPDSADTWFYLGYAYHGLHQDADARSAYEKAVQLNPELYQAQANLGLLLFAMKDVPGALTHLQKAVALKPGDARPHLDLGIALDASGQTSAADAELRQALQLDPKLEPAAYRLGKLELDQKQYRAAAEDFEKALAINPERTEAELGLASAYEGLGQPAEASQQFEKYLKLQPTDTSARFHLARLYFQEGKTDLALAHLQQLVQTHVELPGLDAALADAYARSGKFSDSESYYRKALAETSSGTDAADLHRALATTLVKEGKATEAESEFRAALRLDPNNADASKGLAESLYLQERWTDAAPVIERLVQSPSAPAGLYFFLATCYDHLRDRKRALEGYERFLQRSNGSNPDQDWQARQRAKLLSRELGKPIK